MAEFTERFFILTPQATDKTRTDTRGNEFPVYLDANGMEMLWSGNFPVPAIGKKVFVTMNGIGWAIVKGYFESCGYLGLMTLPTRPPAYLRRQLRERLKSSKATPNWIAEGIGCQFGSELAEKRPPKLK